jgi:hypothetical protein
MDFPNLERKGDKMPKIQDSEIKKQVANRKDFEALLNKAISHKPIPAPKQSKT